MKTTLEMVREVMDRGEYVTPFAIQSSIRVKYGVQVSDSAITARIRDLRKPQFGGHTILCRTKANSKGHEYQMIAPGTQLDLLTSYPWTHLEVLMTEEDLGATR